MRRRSAPVFEDLKQGPVVPGWGHVGTAWAQQQQPAPDAVGRGEVRWGASANYELDVLDGKSGILIQQTAVPVLVTPPQTLIQTPRVPERVWELGLGLLWPNSFEGLQGPANGITLHSWFRVNFGVGSMQQTIVLASGPGIVASNDIVTTTRPFENTGLEQATFDIANTFFNGAVVSATEFGVCYINACTFNIEGYVWAENLPGAPFGTAHNIMHATLYCGVSPYTRGSRS